MMAKARSTTCGARARSGAGAERLLFGGNPVLLALEVAHLQAAGEVEPEKALPLGLELGDAAPGGLL